MEFDASLFALIGFFCFLVPFLFFAAFRRVNRPIILLLSISFVCFAFALGAVAWESYQQGIAHVPAGRRTTGTISRDQQPTLFFFMSMFMFICVAGLASMGAYLLRIALMRRGGGPN